MSSPSQTPMEDCSKYPPQLCQGAPGDLSGLFKRNKTESPPKQPAPSSSSKYPIQDFRNRWINNSLREQFEEMAKEAASKRAKNGSNNPTTSTGEDAKASTTPHQTCRFYFPKTASQEDANASDHTPESSNELPAAIATAFHKLNLAGSQASEGEAGFEQEADFDMVEKEEAMEDEDDMVVVEATEEEEEEDYVEV